MLIIAALIGLFAAKSNTVEPAIAPKNSDIECQAKLEHRPNGGGSALSQAASSVRLIQSSGTPE